MSWSPAAQPERKRCVILGATGFIGSHVTEAIAGDAGLEVVALLRPGADAGRLEAVGVRVARTDSQGEPLRELLAGASFVVNCVSLSPVGDAPQEAELALLRRVLDALPGGLELYLQLSSIIAYGEHPDDVTIDEQTPPRALSGADATALAKEALVAEVLGARGLDFVILQPVSTIGARDRGAFFARIADAYRQGKFPLIDGGGASFPVVDTRDVGRAFGFVIGHRAELRGRTLIVGGEQVSWRELKEAFDRLSGERKRALRMPGWLLRLVNAGATLLRRPLLDERALRALTHDRRFSDRRLRELGFEHSHTWQEGLQQGWNAPQPGLVG